jgi:hypothetical protein
MLRLLIRRFRNLIGNGFFYVGASTKFWHKPLVLARTCKKWRDRVAANPRARLDLRERRQLKVKKFIDP